MHIANAKDAEKIAIANTICAIARRHYFGEG
jgi:hypothetical protein